MENSLCDIKLERQAINAILSKKSLVDVLIERTDEDCFTDKIALAAYLWMVKQYHESKRISLVRMKRETDIDLEELIASGTNLMDFAELLDILLKLKFRRELADSARKINCLASREDLDIEEYGHRAQEIVFSTTSSLEQDKKIYQMNDVLEEVFSDIADIQQGKRELTGLRTNLPSIDRHTSGLQPGHLTVIGGKSSMGKTAFALSLTYSILKAGRKVVFISLEMLAKEIGKRLLALDSLVPTSAYNFKLIPAQKQNMDASLSRLMNYNLLVSDRRGLTVEDIKAICRNVFRERGRYDLIVIDYLQRIAMENSRENMAKRVGNAVSSIRDLAGFLEVPVILISQLRRTSRGRPDLSALRDSGEIEENADEVWFPFRPSYDENISNEERPEEGELIFAKGRTSGEGFAKFIWYPSIQYWRDVLIEKRTGPLMIVK